MKKLYRNSIEGKIAGVCAGIGDYFEIDPVIVRVIFLALFFYGFLMYILFWILAPKQAVEHIYGQHNSLA